MAASHVQVLKEQGRGVAGALLVVGVSLTYTMESWWLAWELPIRYLLVYALFGLGVVLVATRFVGFRDDEDRDPWQPWQIAADFAELVLQSFVTAYLLLLLLGVLSPGDSLAAVVRVGLFHVVPLGFGAALANVVLGESEEDVPDTEFPRNVAVFAVGALFVAFPIAPTEEMVKIAVQMDWLRTLGLVAVSLFFAYLVLFALEFRGQSDRVAGRHPVHQLGTVFVIYAVAVAVSTVLLAAFGQFLGTTVSEMVQQILVLSFPASVGASAGEVVL